MAQSISQEAIGATGLPGATAASRHAGATASGAPTTGTFAVGDFVVDQTGAMYVCTVAGTPGTWQLSGVSVNENIAGKNFLINGGMDIWQRGTSFVSTTYPAYNADRWQINNVLTTATTVSQVASGLTGFQYATRIQRQSGQTGTANINIGQSIETKNSIPMAGQTVTFSFWARAGANYSATSNALNPRVVSGTGTDENVIYGYTGASYPINTNVTLTTSWQRFTLTATISSTATELGVYFVFNPTGTAGTNDYFDISGVQLEIAPQATPFSRAGGSIGGELALCQRYYQQPGGVSYQYFANGYFTSTTQFNLIYPLPVTMRTSPSFSSSGVSNFNMQSSTTFTATAFLSDVTSPTSCGLYLTGLSGATIGRGGILQAVGSTAAALYFNAEL